MKKYLTEEERKAARRESQRKWAEKNKNYQTEYYQNNREKITNRNANWKQDNKEENAKRQAEYLVRYRSTPMGRAVQLVSGYKRNDKKYNRGECTLTAAWVVEHIFTQPCAHCGKTGWKIIGCNRLDNSLPHTPENVEPCCQECNLKLEGLGKKKISQYTLDGELVKVWPSESECSRNGFHQGHISACCLGKLKSHKGFIWKYT